MSWTHFTGAYALRLEGLPGPPAGKFEDQSS